MVNPITHKDEQRLSVTANVYDATTMLTTVVAGYAMGRMLGWFSSRHGLVMGAIHAPISFLRGRVDSNLKSINQRNLLKQIGVPEAQLPPPKANTDCWDEVSVGQVFMAMTFAAPMLARLAGHKTGLIMTLKYHVATSIVWPITTMLTKYVYFKVADTIGIPPSPWFRQYGIKEIFTRPEQNYPAVDAQLSPGGIRYIPELPAIDENMGRDAQETIDAFDRYCRGLNWGAQRNPTNAIIGKMRDALKQKDTPVGKQFFQTMANIQARLADLPVDEQKSLLVHMSDGFSRCASQWLPVATKTYVGLATGDSPIEQRVAWYNQELKDEILRSYERFSDLIADIHAQNRLKTVLREELGIYIAGGEDAEAMIKGNDEQVANAVEFMAKIPTWLGLSREDTASLEADRADWVALFLREYTPPMLVAKHHGYWSDVPSEELSGLYKYLKLKVQEKLEALYPEMEDADVVATNLVSYCFSDEDDETFAITHKVEGTIFLLKMTGDLVDDDVLVAGMSNNDAIALTRERMAADANEVADLLDGDD